MPIFDLFKPSQSTSNTDDGALGQIANADTVRTSGVITKFTPVTAGQVSALEAQLRRREEQQKNFFKLLDLKEKWSKLDTEANVRLFSYLANEQNEVTQRRIARYPLKLAIEQSRLAYAKADHQLASTRQQIDAEIAQLQQAQVAAGKQLKGRKAK